MKRLNLSHRKLEHIEIVQERDVQAIDCPFDALRLPYRALPELNLDEVRSESSLLGRALSFPLIISSMTGGPEKAAVINRNLAVAAQAQKVALALGSMRVCLHQPETLASFQVRAFCPDIPLLANIGLVQLNYGVSADQLNELVAQIDADGLYFHINALQEAIQPEGDTNFKGLIQRLAQIIPKLKVPVLVKEVGCGLDLWSAQALVDAGVTWLDVAGMGGTSWTMVEGFRREDRLGQLFKEVGLSTVASLEACRTIKGARTIASGGIRSGLDMFKALCLGAELSSAAKPFLGPALESADAASATIASWRQEFRVAMFCCGIQNIDQAGQLTLQKV